MAGYQRFIIRVGELRNISEIKSILKILSKFLNLNCDIKNVDADFSRENQWGYYPAIKIRNRDNYCIEVAHIGYYPSSLPVKLSTIKVELRQQFKNVTVSYLNIDELREL